MYDLHPEKHYSFKRSRELGVVLNTGEVPQVVVEAYRDSRLPGKYALETAEALTGEAATEKDREEVLKVAVARMSGTAVEDWEPVRIQRVVLFLATIRRYTSDKIFTQVMEEPESLTSSPKGSVPKSDLPDVDASPVLPGKPTKVTFKKAANPAGLSEPDLSVGASSLADDDDIDLAETEKPQAPKSHDPRDMIYDHVRWFDLEADDRHYLLEELRRQIPEKAGDAKDASSMAWNILRGFLRGKKDVDIMGEALDMLIFFKIRSDSGPEAAKAYDGKMRANATVPASRKEAFQAASKKSGKRSAAAATLSSTHPKRFKGAPHGFSNSNGSNGRFSGNGHRGGRNHRSSG